MSRHVAALILTGSSLVAFAASFPTSAGPSDTLILDAFRDAFAAARALPLGSRPPPPDLKPAGLVHTPFTTLKAYLGHATHLDCDDLLTRPVKTCASFTFGPAPTIPVDDPPGSITVTTGGPWLLVVGLSQGRVVDARWLGQK